MVALLLIAGLLGGSAAIAPQEDPPPPQGVIYGLVLEPNGNPAKGLRLTAHRLGGHFVGTPPRIRTDDSGHFRFENLPWWGKSAVYVQDEDAGYSLFSTRKFDGTPEQEVEISPEHPQAEFNFQLPPKAGFLHIHLTDRRTGATISDLEVKFMSAKDPTRPLFYEHCTSSRTILLPPDRDLLLHVKSAGYQQWEESAGDGRLIRIPSGSQLTLEVELEHEDP